MNTWPDARLFSLLWYNKALRHIANTNAMSGTRVTLNSNLWWKPEENVSFPMIWQLLLLHLEIC